jgi:hypothetical protein
MTGAIMKRFSSDRRKPVIRITPNVHAMISPQIARIAGVTFVGTINGDARD